VRLDCYAGCGLADILEALRARRLIPERDRGETRPPPRRRREPAREAEEDGARRNRELAQVLWRESEPIADGPPLAYLTRERGIRHWDCDRVRFHPACPFGRDRGPAVIAPVHEASTGLLVAVWRIRLDADGRKVERRGLGPTRGNCSRLFWAGGDHLAVAEGVEDALAWHQLTGVPTWAALGTGFMAAAVLPARFARVDVIADGDKPGLAAAQHLAIRLKHEGRAVRILRPPAGIKDASDAVRAGVAA